MERAAHPWRRAESALRSSVSFRRLRDEQGDVVRLPVPAAAWTIDLLARDTGRPVLVVVPHEVEAYAWLESAKLFRRGLASAAGEDPEEAGDAAIYFPAPSLTPYQETDVSLLVRAEESAAIDRIMGRDRAGNGDGSEPRVVLTTPRALFRRLPTARDLRGARLEIASEEDVPLDDLVDHLLAWGYHRSDLVFEVGHFAVRGGVFDLWPPGVESPIRLDFFGDTVESIRRFDVESQRSQGTVQSIEILPLSLFPQGKRQADRLADLLARIAGMDAGRGTEGSAAVGDLLGRLRDEAGFPGWEHYLPLLADETSDLAGLLGAGPGIGDDDAGGDGGEPIVVVLDRTVVLEEIDHHADDLAADYAERVEQDRLAIPPDELAVPADAVRHLVETAGILLGDLLVDQRNLSSPGDERPIDFSAGLTDLLHDQLPRFPREVETARSRGDHPVLVVQKDHRERMVELLAARDLEIGPGGVELVTGDLQRGFRLPAAGITVWSERQLFRKSPLVKRRSAKKRRYGPFLSSIRDLKPGDYVVHQEHGIGQFIELRTLGGESTQSNLPPALREAAPEAEAEVEVMEISYATGRSLLLPLTRLDQIQKYSGLETVAPRLDRLGGTSWKKTKNRIKAGMRDMAEELLKLYAERKMAEAPQIEGGTDLQAAFEANFPFEETSDQLDAIDAIYEDLKKSEPMDRLLCGDVGFGKTEVAMRAALRAVEGGHQVAVLAPTTILCDQHYEKFRERFGELPVNIEMMSRFRSNAEVKKIQAKAEAGEIDILIGTHRLLARQVQFPELGLVIIDEEQRFGVAHKERLKKMRKDVHVLAMSATPVPRTLQLSLAGVRDLSLIETPPRDRMAVETAILPFDPRLVREAVDFEKERGGQIYYVYNRVETIENFAQYLREVVPGLRVTVGHGQMDEKELARRMHAFTDGEYDLLLATTIIENGIDIPNVNTMLVHNAERFGLAQLYQLRGRVGRSDQLAYCYLLISGDRVLSEDARKRLDAIREFTELGSGFRVAGRDLEIRGAGNLLGAEQSGHINAVGIETYLKMLEETVAELKGEAVPDAVSVTLDFPIPASVPESYVGDTNLRMEIYQRLASGDEASESAASADVTTEDLILEELRDRFGEPPEGVRNLVRLATVKRMAETLRLQSISARRGKLVLRLRQDAAVEPERLVEMMHTQPGCHFSPDGALTVQGVANEDSLEAARNALEFLSRPSSPGVVN